MNLNNDFSLEEAQDTKITSPYVGEIVLYFALGSSDGKYGAGTPRAAIITKVGELGEKGYNVGLCIVNPTGLFFNEDVKYGREKGCWDYVYHSIGR